MTKVTQRTHLAIITSLALASGCARAPQTDETVVLVGTTVEGSICPWFYEGMRMVAAASLLEGLYVLDEQGRVVPGVARSHEVSTDDDGRQVWTVHLRRDKRWSNGDPVTARDFEWTYWRQTSPVDRTGAKIYAGPMYYVVNAIRFVGGACEWSEVGVKCPNDYTIQFTLENPTPDFLGVLTMGGGLPVHRATYQQHGMDTFSVAYWVGNGAYLPIRWVEATELEVARNLAYVGELKGNIDRIVFQDASRVGLPLFETGEVDILYPLMRPSDALLVHGGRNESLRQCLRLAPSTVIQYLYPLLNRETQAVFADQRVRQAIAMAIPKREICENVVANVPFTAIDDCDTPVSQYFDNDLGLTYDSQRARQLLAEAGYPDGMGFPVMTLNCYGGDPDAERMLSELKLHWEQTLNIRVNLELTERGVYNVRRLSVDHDYCGWTLGGSGTLSPNRLGNVENMLHQISFWDLPYELLARREHHIERFPDGEFLPFTYKQGQPGHRPEDVQRWIDEARDFEQRLANFFDQEPYEPFRQLGRQEVAALRGTLADLERAIDDRSPRQKLLEEELQSEGFGERVDQLQEEGLAPDDARQRAEMEQLFLRAMYVRARQAEFLWINGVYGSFPSPALGHDHVVWRCSRLLHQVKLEDNPQRRRQMMRQLKGMINQYAFAIPLWCQNYTGMVRPFVENFQVLPYSMVFPRMSFIRVDGKPPTSIHRRSSGMSFQEGQALARRQRGGSIPDRRMGDVSGYTDGGDIRFIGWRYAGLVVAAAAIGILAIARRAQHADPMPQSDSRMGDPPNTMRASGAVTTVNSNDQRQTSARLRHVVIAVVLLAAVCGLVMLHTTAWVTTLSAASMICAALAVMPFGKAVGAPRESSPLGAAQWLFCLGRIVPVLLLGAGVVVFFLEGSFHPTHAFPMESRPLLASLFGLLLLLAVRRWAGRGRSAVLGVIAVLIVAAALFVLLGGSLSVQLLGAAVLIQVAASTIGQRVYGHKLVTFVVGRVATIVLSMVVVLDITFLLMHLAPGDFFQQNIMDLGLLDQMGTAREEALFAHWQGAYGLDKPILAQLDFFLKGLLTWDIGPAFYFPATDIQTMIWETLPRSLLLALLAVLVALVVGLPLGVVAALRHGGWIDKVCVLLAMLGQCIPPYLTAVLLILVFAVYVPLVPSGGWGSPTHLILPVAALALMPLGNIARYMRSSMVTTLGEDYIRTAWAKGGRPWSVVVGHALRNSLIPLITVLGPQMGALMIGAVWVETLFRVPGLGKFFARAAELRDYPLLISSTFVLALAIMVMNLLVDIAYGILDPRMRAGREHG